MRCLLLHGEALFQFFMKSGNAYRNLTVYARPSSLINLPVFSFFHPPSIMTETLKMLGTLRYPPLVALRLPALVTVLVYGLNVRSGVAVGNARQKYKVSMPGCTGPEEFNRIFRAHANNAEQYPQFLALMWVFSVTVDPFVGGTLGLLWVVFRHLYVSRYHRTIEGLGTYTIPAYLILTGMSMAIMVKIALSFLS